MDWASSTSWLPPQDRVATGSGVVEVHLDGPGRTLALVRVEPQGAAAPGDRPPAGRSRAVQPRDREPCGLSDTVLRWPQLDDVHVPVGDVDLDPELVPQGLGSALSYPQPDAVQASLWECHHTGPWR